MVERAIEEVVRTTAWDMGAVVDLGEKPDVAEVRAGLEEEIEENRSWLLDLLSLLYDRGAIAVVKESLASARLPLDGLRPRDPRPPPLGGTEAARPPGPRGPSRTAPRSRGSRPSCRARG